MKNTASPRVSSPPSEWWKLHLLADVVSAMSEYQKTEVQTGEEEKATIFVNFPRTKRTCLFRRSSCVIDKQSSVTCVEGNKEVINLKKGEIFGRFEVGSCSRSIEGELLQNPNLTPLSSIVNECKKRRLINFCQEEEERSLKKRRIVQNTAVPEWLVIVMMREEINGYDPKLVLEKKIHKSDIDKVQSRLSLPSNQVVTSEFRSEEDSRVIYEQSVLKNRTEGLSVVLVDPLLKKHVVDLRKWKMGGRWNYVFVDGWNQVVSINTFKVGNVYHVWSFRSGGGKLCFALVPPGNSNDSGHGSSCSGLSSW